MWRENATALWELNNISMTAQEHHNLRHWILMQMLCIFSREKICMCQKEKEKEITHDGAGLDVAETFVVFVFSNV